MRQKFDVGDLVLVDPPVDRAGVVIETKLINIQTEHPKPWKYHQDEYSCRIKFLHSPETKWIRAKLLSHLSKISE